MAWSVPWKIYGFSKASFYLGRSVLKHATAHIKKPSDCAKTYFYYVYIRRGYLRKNQILDSRRLELS